MAVLIAYFSASGITRRLAEELAAKTGAELFEIVPEKPYTEADLKWTNPFARCNSEKFGKKSVPVRDKAENFGKYDTVWIGFPIWYGCAPNVVNSFCRQYDFSGKKVYVFATSGGSGIGKTAEKLQPYIHNAVIADARLLHSADDAEDWC